MIAMERYIFSIGSVVRGMGDEWEEEFREKRTREKITKTYPFVQEPVTRM